MKEELEQKTLEGIDGFFTKLTEATDIVSAKLVEVAPDAAEAILGLVQIKGIFSLVNEFAWFAVFFLLTRWLYGVSRKRFNEGEYEHYDVPIFIFAGAGAGVAGVFSLCMLGKFLRFYDWLAAIYPEGAVALTALNAVGINL